MKRIYTITTIIFLCLNSLFSQTTSISGKIISEENNAPLSYVNIGIPNKNLGTVSREDGSFTLKLPREIVEKDTLIFSYIGYETQKIATSKLKTSGNEVILKPAKTYLDEVVLETQELKAKKIGRTNTGLGLMHYNFYTADEKDVDDRLSKELGMNLKLRRNCRLEKFNFAVTSNDFKSLKFRINIYNIKNNEPDSLLISNNIIFELKDKENGWQSVDLDPYNIYLKEEVEEIMVSIQWLESVKAEKDSKYFAIAASQSPFHKVYFRNKAMDSWASQTGSLSMYIDAKCDK
ncbi:carboxypeptidase-like regulatory domain-containing protein [Zunongwangia sp. F363]|uniref:Carboxypeptidase-like regulatory domain-containing protein n=1 Tax=Autumnicola tepida TaxID=3075595 RepID=A0ABU3CFB6_9FLAO|nr:carboxypeptidase-like regulatory domain-containing protein [Zunongwangia sp. F363]MDT0644922.1 carboxypeptidase-like regulatory domain-containing protein [Zunongwangia sp. F363]